MIAALLALLAPWALGTGLAGLLVPRDGLAAAMARGALLGPPSLTLMGFALIGPGQRLQASIAYALLALAAIALAAGLARLHRASDSPPRPRWFPIAVGLAAGLAFGEQLLAFLAVPAPRGDGLLNFAVKARVINETAAWWSWMLDPRMQPLHPDYPLHQPILLGLGPALGGRDAMFAAIAPMLLWKAGIVAVLGIEARDRGPLTVLAALALGLLWNGMDGYARAGYADPQIAGLLLLAVPAWCARERWPLAALATGLLPWVKLEGAVLAAGVLALVVLLRPLWPKLAWIATGALLAAIWPAVLLALDLFGKVQELPTHSDQATYLRQLADLFRAALFDPGRGHLASGFALVASAAYLLATRRAGLDRVLCLAACGIVLGYPLLTWMRQTYLQGGEVDVPFRLVAHAVPLILVLAARLLGAENPRAEGQETSSCTASVDRSKYPL